MEQRTKKVHVSEDWTVVLMGFFIIVLSITGLRISSPTLGWSDVSDLSERIFVGGNVFLIVLQFLFLLFITLVAAWLTGRPLKPYLYAFPFIYFITVTALVIAGNSGVKSLNLEAVMFSLIIGLLIGNLLKLPGWFKDALSTELFVKIGLVLLGTGIIFNDILKAGVLGLLQALIVVISVWYFAYWICKRLKVDEELTMMISSAVSICGVSAAIATAGAIKGDTKKLSYVISMVLITAIPMMIAMPYIARYYGFSQEVTGAWLGGSIDTTGAVVASGSLVGETALKVSTIVKFSQNVLLGLAAFVISVYWTYAGNKSADVQTAKPTLGVIWERFPKFVVGFIAASLLFSFMLNPATVNTVKEPLKNLQSLWFALAFTSIGLETNFAELLQSNNRNPLYAFLIAQVFNILVTLVIAYFLFG